MKETRTFGEYKYTVESDPKVSKIVDLENQGVDICWDFKIYLLEHPEELTKDMLKGILNFIGEMEKSYLKSQMKSAMDDLVPKKNGLTEPFYDPAKDPYSPYGKLIFADNKTFTSETKN